MANQPDMYYIYSSLTAAQDHVGRIDQALGLPHDDETFVGGGIHVPGRTETFDTPQKHPLLDLWAVTKDETSEQYYQNDADSIGEITEWL